MCEVLLVATANFDFFDFGNTIIPNYASHYETGSRFECVGSWYS